MLLEAGMKKNKLVKISAIIAAALLISACSTNVRGPQEKIAVINWEQAVSAHPQYAKLEQGEKILQDLLNKRKGQEELAKPQLSSLNKLRSLRQLSQQSFMDADFNTRMVEQKEIENAKLQKFVAQAEADADNQLAARKKDVEDAYKLKLFNLRALLEAVKMKPDERQAVEKQLQELQKERGAQIADVRIVVYRGAAGVHLDQVGVIGYEQLLLMRQRIIKIHLKLPPNLILHKITPLMPRGTRGGQSSRFHSHLSLDMHLSPLPDARSLTAPARAFSR